MTKAETIAPVAYTPIAASKLVCSGFGQYHTNEPDADKPSKKLTPYVAIDYEGICALVDKPQEVEKKDAQWLIPSTMMSRTFKEQERHGQYAYLWADIDKNAPGLDAIVLLMEDFDFEAYTSRSATEDNPKCRVLIRLFEPVPGDVWLICQRILNDKLEAADITPDRKSEGAAQLCYLPNRGQYYDTRSRRTGFCLEPVSEWAAEIAAIKAENERAERDLADKTAKARASRATKKYSGKATVLEVFNQAYTIQELLLMQGYAQRGNTFRHPASESGSYSASVKDGRVHSLSSSDPLYTQGSGVGAHDAFSVFCTLWCAGDMSAALKLAGEEWLVAEKLPPTQAGTDVVGLFQPLILTSEDVAKMANAEFLIPNMIVRGHLIGILSPGNGGKTTIMTYLCEQLVPQGLNVLYINVDGSPSDLKRHQAHAAEHGYQVVAPDAKSGKSTDDVMAILESIVSGDATCKDLVLIFDTLKKFLDVINKVQAKNFYKLMRALTVRGATIILLGHTNKYAGEDGKQIYEGTADLRNDLDELIYLDSFKNEAANTLEVTTRPDKVRAEFAPRSFTIHLPDRRVTEPLSVINILAKDDREILNFAKEAIRADLHNQQDIIGYVESRTEYGPKKIRKSLQIASQRDVPEIIVGRTGSGKELHYSLAPTLAQTIAGLKT